MYLLPEVYTLFISFLFITSIVLSVYIILQKQNRFEKNNDDYTAKWTYLFFGIAVLLIVFSIFAPFIFTAGKAIGDFDSNTASTGDTLGGIMGPFIAIAGVIVTGLAFYIQYKANQQILDQVKSQDRQYRIDKFESQFYEMLRLHKENVNEMSIEGYEYKTDVFNVGNKIYNWAKLDKKIFIGINSRIDQCDYKNNISSKKEIIGRKIFYLMLKEFHALFLVVKKTYLRNPTQLNAYKQNDYSLTEEVNMYCFKLAYCIFFSGKDIFKMQIERDEVGVFADVNMKPFCDSLLSELEIIRTTHKCGVRYIKKYFGRTGMPYKSLDLSVSYKPFGGHQIRLPHYYRHMISLVKHVIGQPSELLSYEEKRGYLKIFRSQLSNYEVVLLYYNWLGGYGATWEDKDNSLFTDYRIIHNLNNHLVLKEFNIEKMFENINFEKLLYKPGKRKNDPLFELNEIKKESDLFEQDI